MIYEDYYLLVYHYHAAPVLNDVTARDDCDSGSTFWRECLWRVHACYHIYVGHQSFSCSWRAEHNQYSPVEIWSLPVNAPIYTKDTYSLVPRFRSLLPGMLFSRCFCVLCAVVARIFHSCTLLFSGHPDVCVNAPSYTSMPGGSCRYFVFATFRFWMGISFRVLCRALVHVANGHPDVWSRQDMYTPGILYLHPNRYLFWSDVGF